MIAYARLRPGPGFSLSRTALYYLQRLAGPHWLRDIMARMIARGVAMRHPAFVTGPGLESQRDALVQNGLVPLPGLVSQDSVKAILAYLKDKELRTPGGRTLRLQDVTPDIATADYPLQTVLSCPGILELINSEPVLGLAGTYLGCRPTLSSIGLRWSFPSNSDACDVQRFHRDPDDWRFVKLFVYLTNVDHDSGPHVYVRGSHRRARGIRARVYSLGKIEAQYGRASVTPVIGKIGTAFMADTGGIHMGMPPRTRPRLLLAAQYSLLPVYAFRYAPLALVPKPAIDPYVNRLIIA